MRPLKIPRIRPLWIFVVAVTVVGLGAILVPRAGTTTEPALDGTLLKGKVAPEFRLEDQFGRSIALSQFRGRPVLLTFMQAHCTSLCPVVAEKLRLALRELGRNGRRVAVIAISADPEHDTPAAVRWFSWKHGMLHRWHYLTGSRRQLTPLWRDYAVFVPPANAPPAIRDSHTSATYLVDGEGREQVLFATDLNQQALGRDLRILLGLPSGNAGVSMISAPEVDHPAPDFALPSVTGSTLSLSSFQGKVVLLNFWATWCIPCRTEMPFLQRTYQRLKRRGFVVLGADRQEPRGDVVSFLHDLHIHYPVVLDSSGDLDAVYTVADLPTSFVIDRQGVIRAVHLGVVDQRYVTAHVIPLLGRGPLRLR